MTKRQPKPPRQISIRGDLHAALKLRAAREGKAIATLVGEIVNAALDGDGRQMSTISYRRTTPELRAPSSCAICTRPSADLVRSDDGFWECSDCRLAPPVSKFGPEHAYEPGDRVPTDKDMIRLQTKRRPHRRTNSNVSSYVRKQRRERTT